MVDCKSGHVVVWCLDVLWTCLARQLHALASMVARPPAISYRTLPLMSPLCLSVKFPNKFVQSSITAPPTWDIFF